MEKILEFSDGLFAHISDQENEGARQLIHEEIKSFNDNISEYHKLARSTGTYPLTILVRDAGGLIIGGLMAETYWGWLDIDDFWLAETHRRMGLGRSILRMAEEEAIARECRYSQLKTFSFQARGFYEKCGYRVTGELKDYPPGHSLYWMIKALV